MANSLRGWKGLGATFSTATPWTRCPERLTTSMLNSRPRAAEIKLSKLRPSRFFSSAIVQNLHSQLDIRSCTTSCRGGFHRKAVLFTAMVCPRNTVRKHVHGERSLRLNQEPLKGRELAVSQRHQQTRHLKRGLAVRQDVRHQAEVLREAPKGLFPCASQQNDLIGAAEKTFGDLGGRWHIYQDQVDLRGQAAAPVWQVLLVSGPHRKVQPGPYVPHEALRGRRPQGFRCGPTLIDMHEGGVLPCPRSQNREIHGRRGLAYSGLSPVQRDGVSQPAAAPL